MCRLGGALMEILAEEYGSAEILRRLCDPLWFQSLGCVLGMDWHSSGITTSVMGALKKALRRLSRPLGLYICGGRGSHSRNTPAEILAIADRRALPGEDLVRCSRLTAKIDNTALQDGFQIYLHCFLFTDKGEWAVVQQGLRDATGTARRYHWYSGDIESFFHDPHTGICGQSQGLILNLADRRAEEARTRMRELTRFHPDENLQELRRILMPARHDVRRSDLDLKRLGAVLAAAYEREIPGFEDLLLLQGLGPRTLQSLALISEVLHGTPTRFEDPARFSFAHGGKDGHPFPVPLKVYDETIDFLDKTLRKARLERSERLGALKNLHSLTLRLEQEAAPMAHFDELMRKERRESPRYGGKTVFDEPSNKGLRRERQLSLFPD